MLLSFDTCIYAWQPRWPAEQSGMLFLQTRPAACFGGHCSSSAKQAPRADNVVVRDSSRLLEGREHLAHPMQMSSCL